MGLDRVALLALSFLAMSCAKDRRAAETPAPISIALIAPATPLVGAPLAASSAPAAIEAPPTSRAITAYLALIHNRIHPLFPPQFGGCFGLPSDRGSAELEIVLEPSTGALVGVEVVRPSAKPSFDVGVVKTIKAAAPFDKAPVEMVAEDGLAYLRWEFFDNHLDACSSKNARPVRLPPPP